ncbi:MAG: hypothetical protein ACLP8A_18560 [Methylovirgula sp.]
MTDNTMSSRPSAPVEKMTDMVARLYREIGISAVAAALAVTKKPAKPAQSETHGAGKDLAA